jgi:hypothetical protein
MQLAAWPWSLGAQVSRELQPELQDPSPDRFVRNIEAAFGQQFLDVAIAEREAKKELDGAADHVRRELVAGVGDGLHSQPYRRGQQPSALP